MGYVLVAFGSEIPLSFCVKTSRPNDCGIVGSCGRLCRKNKKFILPPIQTSSIIITRVVGYLARRNRNLLSLLI